MKKSIFIIITITVLIAMITGIILFITREPASIQDENVTETQAVDNDTVSESDKPDATQVPNNTENEKTDIIEISVDDVSGITPQQAEELCYSVMGTSDAETGFPFSFGVSGAIEKEDKQYYTIRASWLVNNSHMSYIGDFFVAADGGEIYSGTVFQGEYDMGNIIWSK